MELVSRSLGQVNTLPRFEVAVCGETLRGIVRGNRAVDVGVEVPCNFAVIAGAAGQADWLDLERGAPEIARLGVARLNGARVAMLGTLRRDGSPRISPIEPYIVNGRLLVGAMAWSAKAADLRRDPRYVLHSTVTGPDSGEGELKLHGLAVQASPSGGRVVVSPAAGQSDRVRLAHRAGAVRGLGP
jgi:hypothetical protein